MNQGKLSVTLEKLAETWRRLITDWTGRGFRINKKQRKSYLVSSRISPSAKTQVDANQCNEGKNELHGLESADWTDFVKKDKEWSTSEITQKV